MSENNPRIAELNRAYARFRLAKSFRGLVLDGVSGSTQNGYERLIHVMLCYSAAEAFATAMGTTVTSWEIDDARSATGLRQIFLCKTAGEEGQALKSGSAFENLNAKLASQLDAFLKSRNDNIRIVATAIRHLTAHGNLAPKSLNLSKKSHRSSLERLAEQLLCTTERHFETWLETAIE